MKLEQQEAQALMAQFQLDGSSVIKTAPGRNLHDPFASSTPKANNNSNATDQIELAPLTQPSLQDLSKMQPNLVDPYYAQYRGYHPTDYLVGLNNLQMPTASAQTLMPSATSTATASHLYYQSVFPATASQSEWANARSLDQYYSTTTHPNHSHHRQYPSESSSQQEVSRQYKTVEMPSPVDSGIGADMSGLIAGGKDNDFYNAGDLLHGIEQRQERALSHRDSPIIIPKLHNVLGFQYLLEAPISTSIRKEDDRMTYVNKGQFYTVSLDYIPDPCKPLKSDVVKSQLMVVFREDKSYEDEIKTWQFWHARQHSLKQRILEIDSKNSSGMIGQVEEVAHNAVQFFWNPSEQSSVKISIAVQCLSTDFSNQKGVKGLPLHVQIDTFDGDDSDKQQPFHRGYCQIKVFCDKGANRKMLHETRRDEKRRLQVALSGRKKSDGEYHEPCDRSEFYHMSDLDKPAPLFVGPSDEYDPRLYEAQALTAFDPLSELEPVAKRTRPADRVMLYVRKRDDQIFTPLHLVPPGVPGLVAAVRDKFGVEVDKVSGLYKQCRKGATVKVDDDMLKHYCNEDTFVIEIEQAPEDASCCTITLVELETSSQS